MKIRICAFLDAWWSVMCMCVCVYTYSWICDVLSAKKIPEFLKSYKSLHFTWTNCTIISANFIPCNSLSFGTVLFSRSRILNWKECPSELWYPYLELLFLAKLIRFQIFAKRKTKQKNTQYLFGNGICYYFRFIARDIHLIVDFIYCLLEPIIHWMLNVTKSPISEVSKFVGINLFFHRMIYLTMGHSFIHSLALFRMTMFTQPSTTHKINKFPSSTYFFFCSVASGRWNLHALPSNLHQIHFSIWFRATSIHRSKLTPD